MLLLSQVPLFIISQEDRLYYTRYITRVIGSFKKWRGNKERKWHFASPHLHESKPQFAASTPITACCVLGILLCLVCTTQWWTCLCKAPYYTIPVVQYFRMNLKPHFLWRYAHWLVDSVFMCQSPCCQHVLGTRLGKRKTDGTMCLGRLVKGVLS